MRFMVFTLLTAVLMLSVLVAYQFSAIAQSRHAARTAALGTWHTVICGIESSVRAGKTTPAQKRAVTQYWDGVLVTIGARACLVPSSK